jgi:hypothetical protein
VETGKGRVGVVVSYIPGRVCNIRLASGDEVSISLAPKTLAVFNAKVPFLIIRLILSTLAMAFIKKDLWTNKALWVWDISAIREIANRTPDPTAVMDMQIQAVKSGIENCQNIDEVKLACINLNPFSWIEELHD